MKNPKIVSLMFNDLGSTYYRQFQPFRAMARNKLPTVVTSHDAYAQPGTLYSADILHLSRLAINTEKPVDAIKALQSKGKKVIIDYDDDLINIPEYNPAFNSVTKKDMVRAISTADGIICTNTCLAAVYKPYAKKIAIIPNYIDFTVIPKEKPKNEKIVIGLTGSPSHIMDWKQVKEPLLRIKEKYKDAVHIIIGGFDTDIYYDEFVPWNNIGAYYKTVNRIDIGICPLLDTPFNKRKTPIKAMELGAMRAAVIASPTMYKELLGTTRGTVVSNEKDWVNAISFYIDNRSFAIAQANNLYNKVKRNMDITNQTMFIYNTLRYLIGE